jgi:N4-gp56 family major capsid protein
MDKPTLLGGTYTLASRTLTEGTRITANPIALAESQVAIPIVELGGPYDNGQTAVAPIGISDFLKRRARHEQIERVAVELRRDYNKVVDTILIALALSTSNQTIGSSGAGGGTTTGMTTDGNPLTDADVRNIKKDLISRNIPTFANGRYLLCLSPQHEVDLAADAAFREIVRYPRVGDGGGPLLSGYLGAYGGFDIVTSNNIPTVAVGSGGAVTGIQAIAMGPNALAWANGMDAMARMDKNDDFQRENRYVWLAEHGFALLDANMVQKVVTS